MEIDISEQVTQPHRKKGLKKVASVLKSGREQGPGINTNNGSIVEEASQPPPRLKTYKKPVQGKVKKMGILRVVSMMKGGVGSGRHKGAGGAIGSSEKEIKSLTQKIEAEQKLGDKISNDLNFYENRSNVPGGGQKQDMARADKLDEKLSQHFDRLDKLQDQLGKLKGTNKKKKGISGIAELMKGGPGSGRHAQESHDTLHKAGFRYTAKPGKNAHYEHKASGATAQRNMKGETSVFDVNGKGHLYDSSDPKEISAAAESAKKVPIKVDTRD